MSEGKTITECFEPLCGGQEENYGQFESRKEEMRQEKEGKGSLSQKTNVPTRSAESKRLEENISFA